MAEVQSGQADFKAILVYDVSRWGRFQDADEGAYHEHVCSRAGIRVHYCGEQFENDGSIGSNLLKTVKRVMAGEYSRELSVKVFAGQCRLVELGYRQGGAAGYGLRRVLIDEHGTPKGELSRGEQKSLQTDRVILVPGPAILNGLMDLSATRASMGIARLAYAAYEEVFLGGERFEKLKGDGARVQRPLWASTGVKNPDYPDTMYVTELVAPGTVNTMPEKTLLAVTDHGEVDGDTISGTYEESTRVLDAIERLGIDPAAVSPDHWRHVHNRMTAGEAPRAYGPRQHRAFLLRREIGA